MEKNIKNVMEAFTEPSLQYLIRDAQRSAICSNNENSYEVLSNLLIDSINNIVEGENNILLKQAIKVVGDLDLNSLSFLTVLYIIKHISPRSLSYKNGIKSYCDVFQKVITNQLIKEDMFDSLELLGLISSDYFYSKKDFYDHFYEYFDGYFKLGIQKSHPNYEKALSLLSSIKLVDNIFINNPFYPEYSKFILVTSRSVVNLQVFVDEQKHLTRLINQDEIKIIDQIYKLYNDDKNKKHEVLELIKSEFNNYPVMKNVKIIWDSCKNNFYLTPLGVLIGKNNLNNKLLDNDNC